MILLNSVKYSYIVLLFLLLFYFSVETSDELTVYIGSWLLIKFVKCLVIILEFSYSNIAVS